MNISAISSVEATVAYLRTLPSIRERCSRVHALAQEGKLEYFDYHPKKEEDVVKFCAGIIEVGALIFDSFFTNRIVMQRDFGTAYDTVSNSDDGIQPHLILLLDPTTQPLETL